MLWVVWAPTKCPLVWRGKSFSLPSKSSLHIDEHLQIAWRCVNLRCEIIDLVQGSATFLALMDFSPVWPVIWGGKNSPCCYIFIFFSFC